MAGALAIELDQNIMLINIVSKFEKDQMKTEIGEQVYACRTASQLAKG